MSRPERVAQAIKEEISLILHDEIKDPRLGFVTITKVEITADLRQARIFFSVLGKEEDYKKTKAALDSALGFIRCLVAQRINLRFVPEIIFREDRSSEYSVRIEQVLNEIKGVNVLDSSLSQDLGSKIRKERRSEPKKNRRMYKKK